MEFVVVGLNLEYMVYIFGVGDIFWLEVGKLVGECGKVCRLEGFVVWFMGF